MAKRSRLIELYQPGRNADIEPLPYLRIFHFRLHIDCAYQCVARVATGNFVTLGNQLFWFFRAAAQFVFFRLRH